MSSFDRNDVNFTDSSDNFKANGAYLEIEDTRGNSFGNTGNDGKNKIKFKAFLTGLQDNFTSNWNSEEVYGRMDPIHTFQNTTREISVSLVIPSVSYSEGVDNLRRIHDLEKLMYPNYETNERKYETTFNIKVLGYLIGDGKNQKKPRVARRENPVKVRFPRERVMIGDIDDVF